MYKKKVFSGGIVISALVIAFGAIILVHELGHFLACKVFDVATPVFSIGFGPALIKKRIKTTTFQIALLPLGGYVSIDMQDLEKKTYWQKMIIIFAGFFNNISLTVLILFFLARRNKMRVHNSVAYLDAESPAEKNDLKSGDFIYSINGKQDVSVRQIFEIIIASAHKTICLDIKRDGILLEKNISLPAIIWMGMPVGYLGINFAKVPTQKTLMQEIKETYLTARVLVYEYILLIASFFLPLSIETIKKPLADIALANQYYQKGSQLFLFFISMMSIQIGIFNILPIPFLDGGQVFIYTLQALSNYRLSLWQASMVLYAFFMLFLMKIMLTNKK